MTPKPKTDELAHVLQKVETWCAHDKVNIIFGELDHATCPIVNFDAQTETPHDEYLVLLGRLNASALVVNIERLSQDHWQKEFTKLRSRPDAPDRNASLHRVEQLQPHVGHIAALKIHAFVAQPQLILSYGISSTWHEDFQSLEYEDELDLSDDDIDPSTSKRNDDLARRLATHPRFPFARNFAKRRYLAESVFKDEKLADNDILDIVGRAEIIYDVDIKT